MLKKTGSILLLIITLLMVGCGDSMVEVESIPQYAENVQEFTMFVPENWTVTLASGAVAAIYSESDPASVSMTTFSPAGEEFITVGGQWEIIRKETEQTATAFTILSEADPETGSGFRKVDSLDAGLYEYDATVGGISCRYRQVLFLKGGYLYLFTYCASPETFDSHLADVDAILEAITFAKDPAVPSGMKPAVKSEKRFCLSDKYTVYFDEDWVVDASTGVLNARFSSLSTNVSILMADGSGYESPAAYFDAGKEGLAASLPSFKLISESTDKTIRASDGSFRPAAEYEYEAEIDGTNWRFCQVITKSGNDLILLTYSTTENYYEGHFSYFTEVLNNFTVTVR